jgi:hypothetical protein
VPSIGEFIGHNPDSEWRDYSATVPFFGHNALVHIALAKINSWSDDVAAYAVIHKVYFTTGGAALPGGDDFESHPSTGWWKNIEKVDFKLWLYGPVLARATILGLYTA